MELVPLANDPATIRLEIESMCITTGVNWDEKWMDPTPVLSPFHRVAPNKGGRGFEPRDLKEVSANGRGKKSVTSYWYRIKATSIFFLPLLMRMVCDVLEVNFQISNVVLKYIFSTLFNIYPKRHTRYAGKLADSYMTQLSAYTIGIVIITCLMLLAFVKYWKFEALIYIFT